MIKPPSQLQLIKARPWSGKAWPLRTRPQVAWPSYITPGPTHRETFKQIHKIQGSNHQMISPNLKILEIVGNVHESQWTTMNISMNPKESQWTSMNLNEFQWTSMNPPDILILPCDVISHRPIWSTMPLTVSSAAAAPPAAMSRKHLI